MLIQAGSIQFPMGAAVPSAPLLPPATGGQSGLELHLHGRPAGAAPAAAAPTAAFSANEAAAWDAWFGNWNPDAAWSHAQMAQWANHLSGLYGTDGMDWQAADGMDGQAAWDDWAGPSAPDGSAEKDDGDEATQSW